jgi:hypothetical protein
MILRQRAIHYNPLPSRYPDPVICASFLTQAEWFLFQQADRLALQVPRRHSFGMEDAVTLWRPVGPAELQLIQEVGMRAFPPRLPEQPIFYPVLTESYAIKIARDWNVPASGAGFVTRFRVFKSFLDRYDVHEAGGRDHLEYWIPAEDVAAFNAAIIGEIEIVARFP